MITRLSLWGLHSMASVKMLVSAGRWRESQSIRTQIANKIQLGPLSSHFLLWWIVIERGRYVMLSLAAFGMTSPPNITVGVVCQRHACRGILPRKVLAYIVRSSGGIVYIYHKKMGG